MAPVDRLLVIILTAGLAFLLAHSGRGHRAVARIASDAVQDTCVTGLDPHVRRSSSYRENGKSFISNLCSGTAAIWEDQNGQLILRQVQALEPALWLPNEINVYAPAKNILRIAGKPDRIDPGRNISLYYYKTASHAVVIFQISAKKEVIVSVSVDYPQAMPNNSFKPTPLRGVGKAR